MGFSWPNWTGEGKLIKCFGGMQRGGMEPQPLFLISEKFARLNLSGSVGIHNHRFGKKLSFCLLKSCSHHEFTRVLRFLPIRYQRITAMC